ncbi:MAG: Na/Pi cotransporter family protein [Cyclobacteriaceae bacterium]
MNYGFVDLLSLIGSLGFFIYGMKVMSEGIQKVAGSKMRNILSSMTSNRVKGVFTGFLITSLVQSSSATTVLVVSFVNAGLLSLLESIGVIMGANIGTTITAWLISIIGFKVKIASYALPIIAIGFPLMFFNKEKVKSWGEVLIGFALLFMGLSFLKGSVPDLKSNPEILEFLSAYTDLGYLSIIIFVAIGTLLTVIVQSSSAAMALTLVMANNGWVPFELAAAMVLGENIGTTITANLAALVGNVSAKRAAFAHFIFNVFGVIWILILIYPALSLINTYLISTGGASPYESAVAIPIALSLFHTSFNIINTLLLVGFAKFIAEIVTKVIKSTGDEEFRLEFISTGLMNTAELSLEEAHKETILFGELTQKMSKQFRKLFDAEKPKKQKKFLSKIRQFEENTDRLEEEISKYLLQVSGSGNLSEDATNKVASLLGVINELERIGDIFFQMSKDIERKIEGEVVFSKKQTTKLISMVDLIDDALSIMVQNLNSSENQVTLDSAFEKEAEINKSRDKFRKELSVKMEKGDYDPKTDGLYKDLIHLIEKLGDHIINVTESISGEKEREFHKE